MLIFELVLFQDVARNDRCYTYEQLRNAAVAFGQGLRREYNIKKGQVVGLIAANDVDQPAVIFGALACGAVVSPINPAYTATELEHQLRDSEARVLIVDEAALPTALLACEKIGLAKERILSICPSRIQYADIRHWSSIQYDQQHGDFVPFPSIDCKSDVAFLVYSSGTTGLPKGVMLTHHNITSNIQQTQDFETLTWDGSKKVPGFPDATYGVGDKILACLPFFHIYGLTAMMINPIYTGVLAVVVRAFDIEKWCSWVQAHRITIGYVVPPLVVQLAKHPAVTKYDLSSLRVTTCGAAPLSKELINMVFKRIGLRIKQGYGMSEAAPTLFTMRWCDWDKKSGSAGWLVPNAKAKICAVQNDDDIGRAVQELDRGTVGELYVQGPNIFKGYFKNALATRNSFVEGWFRTGDVGYIDEDGDLFITDRTKELIKYKGFQVAPAELEGLLLNNEIVQDAAVIGVDMRDLGTEVPRAYVVRRGGMRAVQAGDGTSITKWLEGKVVAYKRLRGGVVFIDEIPKSGSGKILRRVLKAQDRKSFQSKL
jgi:acyl-CoA synthetase (AMP-forming)/AMP-acid ligase II